MGWANTDQIGKCALRMAFGALIYAGFGNACFAQEPPLNVGRAGQLPGTVGCDAISAGGMFGAAAGIAPSGSASTSTVANTGVTNVGNGNFGTNVPLYGTDLNGNVPLYSTPDLGANFPLYTNPTPGMNSPLFANPTAGDLGRNGATVGHAINAGALRCRGGIPVGGWVLYPSIRASSQYSNNLFLTPTAQTKVVGFGATPILSAEWTNGIHTTTIRGTVDTIVYPTDNAINTLNSDVTLIQSYSPLPDLSFTALGDFSHQTIASSLTNSIPTPVTILPATPTLLPNGNILLPNGNIVAQNGQIVGTANQALANSGTTLVNPSNQYTASGTVSKILNGGFVSLTSSFALTDYQTTQGTGPTSFTSFKTETFSESSSFAVGPLFYVYSNGSYSLRNQDSAIEANSDAYRLVGGIGTRQFGLFRASTYVGYQGSFVEGSGSAGGNVYGATISYYPTYIWAITAALDQTNNISSQTTVATQALTLPTNLPIQIPVSSSTRVTTPSLQSVYQVSPLWTFLTTLSYSRSASIGSPQVTDSLLVDLSLSYEIWRNMTLTGDYQFADISSNVAGQSTTRSLIMLSANYRF